MSNRFEYHYSFGEESIIDKATNREMPIIEVVDTLNEVFKSLTKAHNEIYRLSCKLVSLSPSKHNTRNNQSSSAYSDPDL